MLDGIRHARKPTEAQTKLITAAGLDPRDWSVVLEDELYLHLVDRGIEQRQIAIIDRKAKRTVEMP